jgi:hypothetical protein
MSVTDKVNDLGFSTAVGLVKWGSIMSTGSGKRQSNSSPGFKKLGNVSTHLRKWLKILIP